MLNFAVSLFSCNQPFLSLSSGIHWSLSSPGEASTTWDVGRYTCAPLCRCADGLASAVSGGSTTISPDSVMVSRS